MEGRKIVYSVVGGVVVIVGIGAWVLSSALVGSNPKSSATKPRTEQVAEKRTSKGYETLDLLAKSDTLKSYEERLDSYKKSIKAFHQFYKLSEPSLDSLSVYSATSYFVVVSANNGDVRYLMNPNGSIVGYFNKDFVDSTAESFQGFKLVKDGSTELVGVFSDNFAQKVQYQEIPKDTKSEKFKLGDFPVNKQFVSDLTSYKPVEDVTFELEDSRYPVHYRVYQAGEKDLLLVNNDGMIVGALPSDSWKSEVFRRAGTGTLVEIKGVGLWVY